ncbi:MAG: flavin reductase family protein, partial [Pseudomonadota bacterium]
MDGSGGHMTTRIIPETDQKGFRNALGQFATGVTVVTCLGPEGKPIGITANSFASVSLDPALVLWSPAKTSTRYDAFMAAKTYAIHVMAQSQQGICDGFVKSPDAFDGVDWTPAHDGTPLINGCLARFECIQDVCHDAGDHTIIIGRVTAAEMLAGD